MIRPLSFSRKTPGLQRTLEDCVWRRLCQNSVFTLTPVFRFTGFRCDLEAASFGSSQDMARREMTHKTITCSTAQHQGSPYYQSIRVYRRDSQYESQHRYVIADFEPSLPTTFTMILEAIMCIWLGTWRDRWICVLKISQASFDASL